MLKKSEIVECAKTVEKLVKNISKRLKTVTKFAKKAAKGLEKIGNFFPYCVARISYVVGEIFFSKSCR
jgi:hypothetical protein